MPKKCALAAADAEIVFAKKKILLKKPKISCLHFQKISNNQISDDERRYF